MIGILNHLLAKDDPRWQDFGLNRPGVDATQAQPTGLQATVAGTQALLECDPTPRADRYRWRGRIVGLREKYQLLASTTEPAAILPRLTPGETLEIVVQAVSGGSQGKASNPVVLTLQETPSLMVSLTAIATFPALC